MSAASLLLPMFLHYMDPVRKKQNPNPKQLKSTKNNLLTQIGFKSRPRKYLSYFSGCWVFAWLGCGIW